VSSCALQTDALSGTLAELDNATLQNLEDLKALGRKLLNDPVSERNFLTGKITPIPNAGSNRDALHRYCMYKGLGFTIQQHPFSSILYLSSGFRVSFKQLYIPQAAVRQVQGSGFRLQQQPCTSIYLCFLQISFNQTDFLFS
jgi:hypothetical protein